MGMSTTDLQLFLFCVRLSKSNGNTSNFNSFGVICIMNGTLDFNANSTYIVGMYMDGHYFTCEPPLKNTQENRQLVAKMTNDVAQTIEQCMRIRAERERQNNVEEAYKKYRFDCLEDYWRGQARMWMHNSSRDELKYAQKLLDNSWLKLIGQKYMRNVENRDRNREIAIQALAHKRKYKDIAKDYGISPDRVSQIVAREERRKFYYNRHNWYEHNPVGELIEPDPDAADQQCAKDWTPEQQYQEFETHRVHA